MVSPFLEGRRVVGDVFGVHVRNVVERLESALVGVVVHGAVSSVEDLALSLEVKRDRAVDVGGHLIVGCILASLIIRFLEAGTCSC